LQSIVLFLWNGWTGKIRKPDAIREVYLQFYRCAWTILKFSLKKPKMQEKHLYEYGNPRCTKGRAWSSSM
jgi:hypothetical protein